MPELKHSDDGVFIHSLIIRTTPAVMEGRAELALIERQNVRRHNEALRDWPTAGRYAEQRTLDFLNAFNTWCRDPDAASGYGSEHITWPLHMAFSNMLNLDLGRLDGGCLSSWMCAKLVRLGIDPDTGVLS